jgi:hypothetical protein
MRHPTVTASDAVHNSRNQAGRIICSEPAKSWLFPADLEPGHLVELQGREKGPFHPRSEATVCAVARSNIAEETGSSENRRHDALRSELANWPIFRPKLPCYPFYRTRSAMQQGARSARTLGHIE